MQKHPSQSNDNFETSVINLNTRGTTQIAVNTATQGLTTLMPLRSNHGEVLLRNLPVLLPDSEATNIKTVSDDLHQPSFLFWGRIFIHSSSKSLIK